MRPRFLFVIGAITIALLALSLGMFEGWLAKKKKEKQAEHQQRIEQELAQLKIQCRAKHPTLDDLTFCVGDY